MSGESVGNRYVLVFCLHITVCTARTRECQKLVLSQRIVHEGVQAKKNRGGDLIQFAVRRQRSMIARDSSIIAGKLHRSARQKSY